MTVAAEPRQQIVLLEPRDRALLDAERATLIEEIEHELPDEILTPMQYEVIADLELRVGRFIDRTEPMFDEHCSAAHKVWKQACEIRSLFLDEPKKLKARARALLGAYKDAQDRARRDEERRLAIEEHQKEQARLEAEAKLLDKQGEKALAKAVRNTPIEAPVVVLPSAVPEVHGLSFREEWYWAPVAGDTPTGRMQALAMLVKQDYIQFVTFNDAGLTAFARRTKGTVKVPGIRFFKKSVSVRR